MAFPSPVITLTEAQILTSLRNFLLNVSVPNGTVEVLRAENNQVPEPKTADFVVMTPLRQQRLETNETVYEDVVFVGSISGTTLTVTSVSKGVISVGQLITDGNYPFHVAANTTITAQVSGPAGGIGVYSVNPSQTLASETLYSGTRGDLVSIEFVVQLDIHGPRSADNTRIIDTLIRSDFGTDQFATSLFDVVPLFCSEARQAPFLNSEQQYEYRWTIDVHLQANPTVKTPEQFATQVNVGVVEAGTQYTGS